ncbi:pumilio homolog 6, chloroplastic [Euphorbia lathyris]|uniref:pumilio homolog 6, chloroplastic n=1 Tax=Euphorbia lathyris TaxID=212925 RepID=UPI00331375B2
MATENPLRMPPHNDTSTFAPSTPSMAMEDIGLLKNGQRFRGNGRDMVPNRSGSAPPIMEGSILAINNLIFQQNSNFGNVNVSVQNSEPERQSYLACKEPKGNLNPRLPVPPIFKENRLLSCHIGRPVNNVGLTSVDDGTNSSLNMSQATLATHKEESEDDHSPHQPSDDRVDPVHGFWSEENASPLVGHSRSLVNLIQEDYPRTPSPVYKQSHSLSSGTTDESVDHEADCNSLHNPRIRTSNSTRSTISTDREGLLLNANPSTSPVSSSSPLKCTGNTQSMQPLLRGNPNSTDVNALVSATGDLNISSLSKEQKYQQQWQYNFQGKMLHHQVLQQQSNSLQAQNAKSHMGARGLSSTYIGMDQFIHSPSKFSGEVQPVLQSSGFTPPLYASAAAYMTSSNPFYSSLQPSGLYPPQYSVGGYAINSSVVPPFMAGYPPHGAVPVVFDGTSGHNFSPRMHGASTGGSIPHGTDLQHLNKFYGQLGYQLQPQFADPSYVHYYQQPYGQIYDISGQFDPLASGAGLIGSQSSVPETKQAPDVAGLDNQKLHHQISGVNMLYQGRGGLISPHYFTGPSNMGVTMQYPSSSLASSVLPGSPMSGTGSSGGRDEMKFSLGAGRYAAAYSGWQGQRGPESFNDTKVCNFLEELKSGKGRRFELSDIAGNIVEFSADQHGSRFIQQKLETCNTEEKTSVFKEVLPFARKLMTDVFGNYVLQKFFEYGTPEQRKELANQLTGQILPLSLQMYGCRVIQKALEVIELDQKVQLVRELDGHVLRCVRDQNGNHVIQKCIESIPAEKIDFIISAFRGHIAALSMHPYGCRVIQRVLEHCTDDLQCQFIVNEILESVCVLAQDQYGNYVTQHVLERGKSQERCQIITKLSGHVVQLSQHKFASNVIEKCLEYGGTTDRELIVEEILGQNGGNDNLLIMMKDQFANYVVQKILDACTDTQRKLLVNRIKTHVHVLKKYTYGKHIVARIEQQLEEDNETS